MALKQYKPTSPARRGLILVDRANLWKGKPVKALTEGKQSTGGRNNNGRITVRFRGGGHKKAYRVVDFKRDKVVAGKKVDVKPGNAMEIGQMPVGTIVHNVELKAGKGGQLARSAGTYAQLVGRDMGYAQLKLASGELRVVRGECFATVGAVSNPDHMNASIGKAGRSRWLGRRPHNRGVTMNPVDHPHGGGEGRTSGGRHPVTPWGKPTKGKKTRTNKSTDKFIVTSRHKSKKKG